jgi:membrane protein YfhO
LNIELTSLYVYCGTLTLLLFLAAPFLPGAAPARTLFWLTIAAAVWMLGEATPLYPIIFTHLPYTLRASLYAGYALMAFCLFAGLTAAFALNRIATWIPPAAVWVVVLATAVDLISVGSNRVMNAMEPSYKQSVSEFGFGTDSAPLRRIQDMVGRANPPLRLDYLQKDIFVGVKGSEQVKLPTADGDNPLVLQRILTLRRLFCGGYWWERDLPVNRPNSPLLDMLNIGYLVDIPDPPALPELRQRPYEGDVAGVRFYPNPHALPRFFLAGKLVLSRSAEETFADLSRPDFRPAEETVVETRDLPAGPLPGRGAVQVVRYEANRIELLVNATGRAFLATSEAFYPGWQATVNGKNVPLYMTNGAFRGVSLDAGSNRVIMTYRPDLFVPAAISLLSVMLVLTGLIFGGDERRLLAFGKESR